MNIKEFYDNQNPKNNKYGAKRTKFYGRTYDSIIEANRAEYWFVRVRNQNFSDPIHSFNSQVTVQLTEHVSWRLDFQVIKWDHKGDLEMFYEDVKGGKATQTQDFRVKLGLWQDVGPAPLYIVTRKKGQWIRERYEGKQ